MTCVSSFVDTQFFAISESWLLTFDLQVVLVAPAENESGTGSSDAPATVVGANGCEFDTCPAGAPATGFNASNRESCSYFLQKRILDLFLSISSLQLRELISVR